MGTLIAAGQDATPAFLNQYYGFADTTPITVLAAAQTQLTSAYTIPANEPVAGSAYEMLFGGNGVWGATQQLIAFSVVVAGNVLLNTIPGIAATAFAASAGFRYHGRAIFVCNTTGVSGSFGVSLEITVTETANAVNPGTASTNSVSLADAAAGNPAVDTTAGMTAVIKCGWASTTGAPTITNRHTIFRKVA